MLYLHHTDSPLGPITMAAVAGPDPDSNPLLASLAGLWFDGQKHFPALPRKAETADFLPVFQQADAWLAQYFRGQIPTFTPTLALADPRLSLPVPGVTPFRRAVWEALLAIPYGETISYGELAKKIEPSAGAGASSGTRSGRTAGPLARAIGGAVGHNPISIIVPCHRVVGANGQLTGYAGGEWRKEKLLAIEEGGRAAALC